MAAKKDPQKDLDSFSCQRCGRCCSNMDNLALFEWEKDRLLKIDPTLDIRPGIVVKAGKTRIILQWGLRSKNGICPLLQDTNDGGTKCPIYSDRPMVCRAFPLSRSGLEGTDELISTDCPSAKVPFKMDERLTTGEFCGRMKDYYGEVFDAAFRLDAARFWIRDLVKYVAGRMANQNIEFKDEEIGLLELAVREGIYDREFLENEIKSLSKLKFSR